MPRPGGPDPVGTLDTTKVRPTKWIGTAVTGGTTLHQATAANGSAPATSTNAAAAGDPWRTGRAPATARPPTRRARR